MLLYSFDTYDSREQGGVLRIAREQLLNDFT